RGHPRGQHLPPFNYCHPALHGLRHQRQPGGCANTVWAAGAGKALFSAPRCGRPNAWHYATAHYLAEHSAAGARVGPSSGAADDPPMLWFSANQKWEPTATKAVCDSNGNIRSLTFEQQVKLCGCIRFGISADDARLLKWREACSFAGTPKLLRR